jgi:hypothetical protein
LLEARDTARPALTITACHPRCVRVAIRDTPLLWARIEEDYWGYELLRARYDQSPGAIPPIPFTLVDRHARNRDGEAFDRTWARAYAEMLADSAASPICDGRWHLGLRQDRFATRLVPADLVRKIVKQRPFGFVEWDFGDDIYPITLREMSPSDSGRVKAWRKHARAGSLPPILLYWVSGLQAYLVLDGHDRLLAASLEDVSPPALALEAVQEEETDQETRDAILQQVTKALAAAEKERARPPGERIARASRLMTVDKANELLLYAFAPRTYASPTRARPLEGGAGQWAREVRREVDRQGIAQTRILDGLTEFIAGA